jgi:fucose 4-O-acetylase-like acetyltransferase
MTAPVVGPAREDFIDWMKMLGILLIVYGHVAGWTINFYTPPVYPKQLGVALFIFVAGFSLARERRDPARAVFNRLFEVFLIGILCALLLTAIGAISHTGLQLSNYFPFLLGANLLFDNFPANPTTWYIGTYIHLLIAWALVVRRIYVTPLVIVGWAIVEIAIRAWLADAAGGFIAYMALPNWMTTFLLGMLIGQRDESPRRTEGVVSSLAIMFTVFAGWAVTITQLGFDQSFPFRIPAAAAAAAGGAGAAGGDFGIKLALSAAITGLYVGTAWMVFDVTRCLTAPSAVRFFSRNTLIVFILHMPLFYLLEVQLAAWTPAARSAASFLLCFVLLAWVGEWFHRMVDLRALRERCAARLMPAARVLSAPDARARI